MEKNKEIEHIKVEIFEKVIEYYNKKFQIKDKFIPGKTKINYAGRVFDQNELINLIDSSLEFWLTEGRFAKQFKEALAQFVGVKYCQLTNSGSSANLLAITALTSKRLNEKKRITPGSEVITVAAGFPTTIFPIIQNNAIPVFVDIEIKTYNIDTSQVECAISNKTKAIFLAHTLGNPFNIKEITQICEDNNLWLIEDNCDALGSKYDNKYTGNFGDISTFSFYPAHHITMGEGGAILTNNYELNRIIKSIREWGRDCWCLPGNDNTCKKRFGWQLGTLPFGYDHKYTYSEFGYNLKITDMQASIGLAQIQKLPEFIKLRIKNHQKLYDGLKHLEDFIILPRPQNNSKPSWFGFIMTLKEGLKLTRTEMMSELEKRKIQVRLLFSGNIIRQPVFDELRDNQTRFRTINNLTNTDKVMNDSLWVGVYPGLTDEIIDYMINQISDILLYI